MINIGLFVKAKINLQNSVDAAAYAGASVQARQLTKIAYLNWEMRNTFKEWMFKYYVLGNMSLEGVKNPGSNPGGMDFRMKPDLIKPELVDPYNWPSVCLHLSTGTITNNICQRYSAPGLPEFGGYNMPGAEEASRAFIDALGAAKLRDCAIRTKMNMYVTNAWAYNVLGMDEATAMTSFGPAVLAQRQGAWPAAVELAMRIRNLEYVVNRPAETSGVCMRAGAGELTNCSRDVSQIESENKMGNERITKAFYSAYRNLATAGDELKETFTLREIAPVEYEAGNQFSASYLFVPASKFQNFKKPYLDLKIMSVNYATFYDSFMSSASQTASFTCDVTKLALPVPGYPLGFYKNPEVLTYYAVKGEAEFVGMFNPFGKSVKLTAYAAAKPFGGRIGPMLFKAEDNLIKSRSDQDNKRSVPYIAGINLENLPDKQNFPNKLPVGEYTPGAPLPLGDFWLAGVNEPVGATGTGQDVKFGLPNMVYDFDPSKSYHENNNPIYQIMAGDPSSFQNKIGLFNPDQFQKFQANANFGAGAINPDQLTGAVIKARAPTLYDAHNYLVPTPYDLNESYKVDSFGFIAADPEKIPGSSGDFYRFRIHAPLFNTSGNQTDLLYSSGQEVQNVVIEYMKAQRPAIEKYRRALNNAAIAVYRMKDKKTSQGSDKPYLQAADGISDLGFFTPPLITSITSVDPATAIPRTCKSLSGQFLYFYAGSSAMGYQAVENIAGCPEPLGDQLQKYFSATGSDANYDPEYYTMEFAWSENSNSNFMKMLSAYMPGPAHGIGLDGVYSSPIGSSDGETMRRNAYSTKFVTLDSLKAGGHYANSTFSIMSESEGRKKGNTSDINPGSIKNYLQSDHEAHIKH